MLKLVLSVQRNSYKRKKSLIWVLFLRWISLKTQYGSWNSILTQVLWDAAPGSSQGFVGTICISAEWEAPLERSSAHGSFSVWAQSGASSLHCFFLKWKPNASFEKLTQTPKSRNYQTLPQGVWFNFSFSRPCLCWWRKPIGTPDWWGKPMEFHELCALSVPCLSASLLAHCCQHALGIFCLHLVLEAARKCVHSTDVALFYGF